MKPINYEGWTITTQVASRGIGTVMTDPWGNTFHQPTICWHSHRLARRYAQKFIDYYIELEDLPSRKRDSSKYEAACNESAAHE
jgi:hypothetical protein